MVVVFNPVQQQMANKYQANIDELKKQYEEKLKKLNDELGSLRKQLESANADNLSLQQKLENVIEKKDKTIKEYESKIEALEKRLSLSEAPAEEQEYHRSKRINSTINKVILVLAILAAIYAFVMSLGTLLIAK